MRLAPQSALHHQILLGMCLFFDFSSTSTCRERKATHRRRWPNIGACAWPRSLSSALARASGATA
eukprot:4602281-Pleurochrysis_carterae.AAC.1